MGKTIYYIKDEYKIRILQLIFTISKMNVNVEYYHYKREKIEKKKGKTFTMSKTSIKVKSPHTPVYRININEPDICNKIHNIAQ